MSHLPVFFYRIVSGKLASSVLLCTSGLPIEAYLANKGMPFTTANPIRLLVLTNDIKISPEKDCDQLHDYKNRFVLFYGHLKIGNANSVKRSNHLGVHLVVEFKLVAAVVQHPFDHP